MLPVDVIPQGDYHEVPISVVNTADTMLDKQSQPVTYINTSFQSTCRFPKADQAIYGACCQDCSRRIPVQALNVTRFVRVRALVRKHCWGVTFRGCCS